MKRRMRVWRGWGAPVAAVLAAGVVPAAAGADRAEPPGPSAVERLVRQEDARKTELAAYDEAVRRNELAAILDAREQAMLVRSESASDVLDPAIRAAILARTPATPTIPATASIAPQAVDEGFAWSAAALGLGAGVAAMCIVLGCVTLVRSHGRLRSV